MTEVGKSRMTWKIRDKDEEVIRDDIKPPPIEVTGKTLDQDIRDTGRSFDIEGGLSLVPLPAGYYKLRDRSKLRRGSLGILSQIKSKYGDRIVSYQELFDAIRPKPMAKPTFSLLLSSLWAHGYLEKYARGHFREGNLPHGQGRYTGVHYKIIEKGNG